MDWTLESPFAYANGTFPYQVAHEFHQNPNIRDDLMVENVLSVDKPFVGGGAHARRNYFSLTYLNLWESEGQWSFKDIIYKLPVVVWLRLIGTDIEELFVEFSIR